MHEIANMLGAWNSYYVMMGSSAAALTGLMFVVISLVKDKGHDTSEEGVSTFSTPTVVHFCGALFTSAVMSAPFRSLVPIAILLGLAGATGLLYGVQIAIRTSRLKTYRPDVEDLSWNVLLPLIAYTTLVTSAVALQAAPLYVLFAPAAVVMLLIFVGIHNAWDVVTYVATGKAEASPDPNDKAG